MHWGESAVRFLRDARLLNQSMTNEFTFGKVPGLWGGEWGRATGTTWLHELKTQAPPWFLRRNRPPANVYILWVYTQVWVGVGGVCWLIMSIEFSIIFGKGVGIADEKVMELCDKYRLWVIAFWFWTENFRSIGKIEVVHLSLGNIQHWVLLENAILTLGKLKNFIKFDRSVNLKKSLLNKI